MKRISDKEIERLIEKFLDGDTSLREEKILYGYFNSGKVSGHLESYIPMFQWYSNGLSQKNQAARWTLIRRILIRTAAVAAGIAFIAGIWGVIDSIHRQQVLEETYAGSFVIVQGKKITDIEKILPELIETDSIVVSTQRIIKLYGTSAEMACEDNWLMEENGH